MRDISLCPEDISSSQSRRGGMRRGREGYSLDIEKGERHRLPKVVAVLARHLEVLVELLLDQRVVLHRDCVPHEVLLQNAGAMAQCNNAHVISHVEEESAR